MVGLAASSYKVPLDIRWTFAPLQEVNMSLFKEGNTMWGVSPYFSDEGEYMFLRQESGRVLETL